MLLLYFLIVFVLLNILLFIPSINKIDRQQLNDLKTNTASFDILKKTVTDKLNNTKSTFLKPVNNKLLTILKNKLKNTTELTKLQRINSLIPYSNNNLYDISKLPKNPLETQIFQYENGTAGWYWTYGTFAKELTGALNDYNFTYYVVRLELSNSKIRKKYNLGIGETTVYLISVGFGKNNEWVYNPLTVSTGSYQTSNSKDFIFESTNDNGTNTTFTFKNNVFNISCSFITQTNQICEFEIDSIIKNSPFFNKKNGCAPCVSGLGTNYWSYTNIQTVIRNFNISDGNLKIRENIKDLKGKGWMDRQWMKSTSPYNKFSQLIINSTAWIKKSNFGLGKYIWININLDDNLQFMIYTFPSSKHELHDNMIIEKTIYNKYSKDISELNKKTELKILQTKIVNEKKAYSHDSVDVIYPVKYEIKIENNTYIIDATSFGDCVTYDHTGNYHWAGSAKIYNLQNEFIGTGFIEANQLKKSNEYLNIIGQGADFNEKEIKLLQPQISLIQTLPSIFLLLLYISLLIVITITITKKYYFKR